MSEDLIKSELDFLKDRLQFRYKLFCEWAFADNRLISDIKKFGQETKEIESKIINLVKLDANEVKGER